MERAGKQEIIDEVKEAVAKVSSIVLADFRGLDVATVTSMRAEFKKAGCEYRVIKNTLLKVAVKDSPIAPMSTLLAGPTAVMWGWEAPSTVAKLAVKYAKDHGDKFKVKGGYFEGQVLDTVGIDNLSKMPGKAECQASMLMTFLAAPQDFVRTLAAGPMNFLYLLQARERQLG